ncbi:MAG: methyltransferase domain-containing protein [Cyanobacteria bacterium P01_F01_bin.53]
MTVKDTVRNIVEDKVKWVYSAQSNQELADRYDKWAKDYDYDLQEISGYLGPHQVARVVTQYLSPKARILDAGAGTGLVGEALHQAGYRHIEGLDLSTGMLEKAAQKQVYTALHQKVLGSPLGFSANLFDGIVSVGVLTYGHAPSHCLDELIHITKPGGYIIFPLIPAFYESSDFKPYMLALEAADKWSLISLGSSIKPLPKLEPELDYQIRVYQVQPTKSAVGHC